MGRFWIRTIHWHHGTQIHPRYILANLPEALSPLRVYIYIYTYYIMYIYLDDFDKYVWSTRNLQMYNISSFLWTWDIHLHRDLHLFVLRTLRPWQWASHSCKCHQTFGVLSAPWKVTFRPQIGKDRLFRGKLFNFGGVIYNTWKWAWCFLLPKNQKFAWCELWFAVTVDTSRCFCGRVMLLLTCTDSHIPIYLCCIQHVVYSALVPMFSIYPSNQLTAACNPTVWKNHLKNWSDLDDRSVNHIW